jgi:hypothetical protein
MFNASQNNTLHRCGGVAYNRIIVEASRGAVAQMIVFWVLTVCRRLNEVQVGAQVTRKFVNCIGKLQALWPTRAVAREEKMNIVLN